MDLAVDGMLLRDDTGIPSGAVIAVPPGPWDDCFVGVKWPVRITWPGALALTITSDQDYMVVFDERREAFCVEPQSGPPDGPNTTPHMVVPARPHADHPVGSEAIHRRAKVTTLGCAGPPAPSVPERASAPPPFDRRSGFAGVGPIVLTAAPDL